LGRARRWHLGRIRRWPSGLGVLRALSTPRLILPSRRWRSRRGHDPDAVANEEQAELVVRAVGIFVALPTEAGVGVREVAYAHHVASVQRRQATVTGMFQMDRAGEPTWLLGRLHRNPNGLL
jgi:hypothetical protein